MPSAATGTLPPVRLGIIGLGNMGAFYVNLLREGQVPGAVLAAVCDSDREVLASQPEGIPRFDKTHKLVRSGLVDAVIVSTPHPSHPAVGIEVLRAGLHLCMEKPLAVDKLDSELLLAEPRRPGQLFACMFQQRTLPAMRKVRELLQSGELGAVRRIAWTVTDWFRTQAYYDSGGWRATWKGEGGGVLINQAVHNLDLWQWFFGQPARIRARAGLGKYHHIEVEDEMTAILDYPDGATGVFTTSTGEAPGINRLEIAAENGLLVLEHGKIHFLRNEHSMTLHNQTCPEGYLPPAHWKVEIPIRPSEGQPHAMLLRNFVAAIQGTEPLLSPAEEGLASVELINGMLQSALEDRTVSLPLDAQSYRKLLRRLQNRSKKTPSRPCVSRTGWSRTHDFGTVTRLSTANHKTN